jgi:hypothetical protein
MGLGRRYDSSLSCIPYTFERLFLAEYLKIHFQDSLLPPLLNVLPLTKSVLPLNGRTSMSR